MDVRIAILCLSIAVGCSGTKEDKSSPGAGGETQAGGESATPPSGGAKGVKGSLELTGPFPGTYTWKADLAVTCGCSEKNGDGTADFTMSDAAGKTFISATVKFDGSIQVRTGNLPAGMKGTGVKSSCKGEYIDSSWHMEIDAPVEGPAGQTGHVKGTLDLGC